MVEVDLVILGVRGRSVVRARAEHRQWCEKLGGEAIGALLIRGYARTPGPNADLAVVEEQVRQRVRYRDALIGDRQAPRVDDDWAVAVAAHDLVDAIGKSAAGDERPGKAGLDDRGRGEVGARKTCTASKLRSNLDQGR